MAAFNCFTHRLLTVPLYDEDFNDELNTIKYIAQGNGYKSSLIDSLLEKHKYQQSKPRIEKHTKTTFISTTYTKIMPTILSSLLSKNNRTVIFKINNSLMNILRNQITTLTRTYISNNRLIYCCLLYTSRLILFSQVQAVIKCIHFT